MELVVCPSAVGLLVKPAPLQYHISIISGQATTARLFDNAGLTAKRPLIHPTAVAQQNTLSTASIAHFEQLKASRQIGGEGLALANASPAAVPHFYNFSPPGRTF